MRQKIMMLILLLVFMLAAVPAHALDEVVPSISYSPESGAMRIICEGLYPGNEYALAVLETDSGGWTPGNLLFLDQLTASEEGVLEAAFIHMNLSGVVMLGGETTAIESPLKLGTLNAIDETDVLDLPDMLTTIGEEAFMNASFRYAYLGDKVESIGARAFKNCFELREIHIPASVKTIGEDAFYGCHNVVIVCTENSTAHIYARDNGLNFRLE